jgi:hypothetical protein
MKRTAGLLGAALIAAALALPASSSAESVCEEHVGFCPDTRTHQDYEGNYVGHDEPAILFYSTRNGSGNSNTWLLRLPHESPVPPRQDGTGGTWNFQRSIAFWFGMALCETESYPNPGVPCAANSDANIKDSPDRAAPDWAGNHVGSGFLELQFYPPGWVPLGAGTSCDPTKWCAAMAVFGLSDSLTQKNNLDCLSRAGEEWADYAFITKSGVPQAPPSPLRATAATFAPDPSKALFMNAGDEIEISMHDSPAGLVNSIRDLTTGQSGSMTASAANGFAHPLFQPAASTCTEAPYAFHPMYATSTEHTRVPWTVHTYNVSFSDEIGHFEYCDKANVQGTCVSPGGGEKKDSDASGCFNPAASLLIQVGGCVAPDLDFDGTSYQRDWSGTLTDPVQDRRLHAESFLFTSPLAGGRNYDRMAFEADLPAIQPLDLCDLQGNGCTNPPPGADFYPLYSTRTGQGACAWQEGGPYIPGTSNTFGGSSTTEYGPTVSTYYPEAPGFPDGSVVANFRNTLPSNPCASAGRFPR